MSSLLIFNLVLIFFIAVLILTLRGTLKRNKELRQTIAQNEKNLKLYRDFTKRFSEIKKGTEETNTKITGANSDEEILNIIGSIVSNNNRLSNNTEN